MTNRKRAAAYVRSSLVRRGPVPKQTAALLAIAREMGYTLGEDDIFVDRGPGEDLGERPGWTALEAAVLRERDRPRFTEGRSQALQSGRCTDPIAQRAA